MVESRRDTEGAEKKEFLALPLRSLRLCAGFLIWFGNLLAAFGRDFVSGLGNAAALSRNYAAKPLVDANKR